MAGWLLQGDLTGSGTVSINMPDPEDDPYEDQVLRRVAYLYSLNPTVTLSVVNSGGNLGTIGSDTRMIAGASTSTTAAQGGFTGEGGTPNISSITGGTYARISQTVSGTPPALPTNTNGLRFPLTFNETNGDLQVMDTVDMLEFFIAPAVAYIASGAANVQAGGAYHISTSSSVSGSALVSSTPVFIDTRANASLYTAGGIGETLDQPTTANNYYLHRVTPASNTPQFMPLYWDAVSGEIREMSLAIFDAILGPMIRNYVVNGAGTVEFNTVLRYNINGAGNTMGTVMADTYLSGSSASGYTQRFVSTSDYRTQEFPNGTPATQSSYTLKSTVVN